MTISTSAFTASETGLTGGVSNRVHAFEFATQGRSIHPVLFTNSNEKGRPEILGDISPLESKRLNLLAAVSQIPHTQPAARAADDDAAVIGREGERIGRARFGGDKLPHHAP